MKFYIKYISNSLGNLLNNASTSYDEIFSDVDVSQYIKNEEALYLFENKNEFLKASITNKIRKKNGVKIKNLSKNEILELEPNLAPVFFNGQLFIGSRHTTDPLAVSKKIFESFINNGGKFVKNNVENIIPNESKVKVSFNNEKWILDKVVIYPDT